MNGAANERERDRIAAAAGTQQEEVPQMHLLLSFQPLHLPPPR
jgi:hypothetical protein